MIDDLNTNPDAPPSAKALIIDLVKNLCRSAHGKAWSETTKQFMGAVMIRCGAAATCFITRNFGGPSEATIRQIIRQMRRYLDPGITIDNFMYVRDLYAKIMKEKNIPPGSVYWEMSQDETVIIAALVMDPTLRKLFGTCGPRSSAETEHRCSFTEIEVTDDENGYNTIVNATKDYVLAHCASIRVFHLNVFSRSCADSYPCCACVCRSHRPRRQPAAS
jgi:hypothetical protein